MALENLSKVAGRLERDIQECTMDNAMLHGATLDNAMLHGATLDNAMLHGAHTFPSLRFPWSHSCAIHKPKVWPGNETNSLVLQGVVWNTVLYP